MALLGSMGRAGMQADTITYSAAMSACEKGGGCGEALALLGKMKKKHRIEADAISYDAAISTCG